MKNFHNKSKYGIVLMVIVALMFQVIAPIASEYSYAKEGDKQLEEVNLLDGEQTGEDKSNGLGEPVKVEEKNDDNFSKADDGKKPEENEELSKPMEQEQEQDVNKEENGMEKENNIDKELPKEDEGSDNENDSGLMAIAKDLGNIFTFKSLKVNDEEASENMVVTIGDGTTVSLDYTWDTVGKDVKAGDFAKIDVPNAFKLDKTFDAEPIKLSNGTIVGTYSLKDNKIRFEFNDKIENVGDVTNGTLGFGVKFNEDKFKEDVVEEIEFNDKTDKTITII